MNNEPCEHYVVFPASLNALLWTAVVFIAVKTVYAAMVVYQDVYVWYHPVIDPFLN